MFDWNEEELTNIIWDEAGEADDHIVPYREGSENCRNKTEPNRETATHKSTEEKTPRDKVDLHGRKFEGSSNFNANGGIDTSGFEEMTELCKDPEILQNPNEGKEQGDFVDYSWANIGSFDDLDRIFCNGDPIFGNVSLGSADELWSSPKEVTSSPGKSFLTTGDSPSPNPALRSTPEHLEIEREYEQKDNQSFTLSYGKLDGSTSPQPNVEIVGKTSASKTHLVAEKDVAPNELANKGYRQKRLLKLQRKNEEISSAKEVQDFYTWTPTGNPLAEYENNLATSLVKSSPSVTSHQRLLQGPDSLQYQHVPNMFVAPSTYGSLTNQYHAIPMLPNIQSGKIKQQTVLPGKATPLNRPVLRMTPQEKIEKLRRSQQMQALLAIQKQQQEFTHQVPFTNQSAIQKSAPENQFQHVEGADVEDLNTLASFDPSSPLEQDDSSTVSVAMDDYSVEDTVLHQLQEIVAKLDVRTRLCIRDSLFRLAQSAMQRHSANETSSTNKNGRDETKVEKEENKNHNRLEKLYGKVNLCHGLSESSRKIRMSDAETETNPIDRTVAHLLFHRPLELSGKHPEMAESPASIKLHKSASLMSLSMGSISDNSQTKQNLAHQVSKVPSPFMDPQLVEQFKNSPLVDNSENETKYRPVDGGVAEVEASQ